nr:transcription factor bHLH118-like [Coffea arabica]XP_027083910.1 transcription factor bHLH118-like [Coffea arabica]
MFSQWLSNQDELFKFISPPRPQQQNDKLLVDVNNPPFNDLDLSTVAKSKPKQGRRRKISALENIEESPRDYIKKIIHRDVERQRRQETAGLHQTLRSLIPSQHLEGKRSISDHIHATVKYIRFQKKKVDELKSKRAKLKEWFINPTTSKVVENENPQEDFEQPSIAVKTCRAGMEITITTGSKVDLPLSRILNFLISEGMSIKSCISTRVNERLLHVIESEVNDEKIISPSELQEKLTEIARYQIS